MVTFDNVQSSAIRARLRLIGVSLAGQVFDQSSQRQRIACTKFQLIRQLLRHFLLNHKQPANLLVELQEKSSQSQQNSFSQQLLSYFSLD